MGPLSHNYLLRAAHLSNPIMVDIRVQAKRLKIQMEGETIRYIQLQSGAKIQVTRDHEAEPGALTRQVELSGKPEQISKAEQLIKEVLAEADAGSSGARSGGRKYNATQQGAEMYQMKIANNKVGLIIRKGGETIKSMQTKSGARIQVCYLVI
ncbi:KH domain-containing protein [Zea mays]|uniref:KH domain-containing protein n=1 Tax=Zea mays TaxID=4577 RepID=A0A1D6P8F5_MAIZE|nr:KH domain-containing protein [Zea mays]